MQKNITKSYEKTNWIAKKTVISADLLNKIEDKLLDLDVNLANKAELNDNQVKENATWSSDKISTWSMEQDGLFWTEREGNFISEDNTYEYKLKEIEIFGDTWQDSDNLSDIQHVGELYVDGGGQEQYKVEIVSCNTKNLLDESSYIKYKIPAGNINNLVDSIYDGFYSKLIEIKDIKTFSFVHFGGTVWTSVYSFDENYNVIRGNICNTNAESGTIKTITFNSNEKYFTIKIASAFYIAGGYVQVNEGNIVHNYSPYKPYIENKQTILLPCQLSRVGDIKDRLFWDESKGKYIVEKNVGKSNIKDLTGMFVGAANPTHERLFFNNPPGHALLGKLNSSQRKGFVKGLLNNQQFGLSNSVQFVVFHEDEFIWYIPKSELPENYNDNTVKQYATRLMNENDYEMYYCLETPQLIETDITEPLYLPTYNNKTHIYVVNNNNTKATIKAKFPLKTASAVANLNLNNTKNSKDILEIQELNVNMVATNFDIDYRVLELEWALEDAGIIGANLLNILNIDKKNNKTLTRYEQAKIIITTHAYEYELLAKQLSRYLEKNIITQDEYDELIVLMEENE